MDAHTISELHTVISESYQKIGWTNPYPVCEHIDKVANMHDFILPHLNEITGQSIPLHFHIHLATIVGAGSPLAVIKTKNNISQYHWAGHRNSNRNDPIRLLKDTMPVSCKGITMPPLQPKVCSELEVLENERLSMNDLTC